MHPVYHMIMPNPHLIWDFLGVELQPQSTLRSVAPIIVVISGSIALSFKIGLSHMPFKVSLHIIVRR